MNKVRNIFFLFLSILAANAVFSQEYRFKQNESIKMPFFNLEDEIKGQLKRVEFIKYEAQEIFGEIKPTNIIKKRIFYFNADNQLEKIEYFKADLLIKVKNYFYLSEEGYDNMVIDDGNNKEEYHYKTDSNGMVTYLDYLKNGELIQKELATYDKNKRILSYQKFEADGSKKMEKKFAYDVKGNIIFSEYGVGLEKETAYFQFQNNKQIEFKRFNYIGVLREKEINYYDAKGNFSNSIYQANYPSGEKIFIKNEWVQLDNFTTLKKCFKGESISNLSLWSEIKTIKKRNDLGGITTINLELNEKLVEVVNKDGMIVEKLRYKDEILDYKEIKKYDLMKNLILEETIHHYQDQNVNGNSATLTKYLDFDNNNNYTKVIRIIQENGEQKIEIEETKIEYAK